MKLKKSVSLVLCILFGAIILSGCASDQSSSNGSSNAVGAYSGSAEISSLLDLAGGQQEVGVELPDGRVTSVKTTNNLGLSIGQKVRVVRQKNGTGSVSL